MKRVAVGLFLLLLLVAVPFSVSRLRQRVEYQGKAASDTASLTLLPTSLSLTPGSGAFLEVFVDTGGASTSGVQVVIGYDSSKIEITDSDQNSANGIQIRNDNLYKLTITNRVDPVQSTIVFMAGGFDPQTGRAAPVTGAGRVATINFRVKDGAAIGSTPFNFKFLGTSNTTVCDASSCGTACANCDCDVYLYQPGVNEDILARVESRSVNIIGYPTTTPIPTNTPVPPTNTPRPTNTPPPGATNTPTPTPQCTPGQTKCCDVDPISGPYRVQNCNSLGRWSSCVSCEAGWSCLNGRCQLMTPTPTPRSTVTNTPTPTPTTMPDLTVQNLTVQPVDAASRLYRISARVRNIGVGTVAAGREIRLSFYLNPPSAPTVTTPELTYTTLAVGLPPNNSFDFSVDRVLPYGLNSIYAWVDKSNLVLETNESNNLSSIQYDLPLPTSTPRPTNTPTNTPTPNPVCSPGQTSCCSVNQVRTCNSLGVWASCVNCGANEACIGNYCRVITPTPRPTSTLVPTNTPRPTNTPTTTPRPTNTPVLPTPTSTYLTGDLNRDGRVDIADLVLVGANFGTNNSQGDVNGDGQVNISDLVLVGANFGRSR